MKYNFKVSKENPGYQAHSIEFHRCCARGKSFKEVYNNMHSLLNSYIKDALESNSTIPMPAYVHDINTIGIEPSYDMKSKILENKILKNNMNLSIIKDDNQLEEYIQRLDRYISRYFLTDDEQAEMEVLKQLIILYDSHF